MTVADQSEISLSICQGTLRRNQFLLALSLQLGFSCTIWSSGDICQMAQRTVREVVYVGRWAQAVVVHGGRQTQMARGAAGRANVSLLVIALHLV